MTHSRPRTARCRLATALATLAVLVSASGCLEVDRTPVAPDAEGDSSPGTYCANENELRCDGSEVQQCLGNVWQTSLTCPDGYACEGTGCVCIKPCGNRECGFDSCGFSCGPECPGQLFCNQGFCQAECTPNCAGRECGDDGCGGDCGDCGASEACYKETGTCGPSKSCTEILQCQTNCIKIGGDVNECGTACLDATNQVVRAEYELVQTCITNSGCDDLICVSQQCGLQYVGCYFDKAGQFDCQSAALCASSCPPESEDCFFGCLESGTQQAQLTYITLNLCLTATCGIDASQACVDTAFQSACKDDYEACFGPLP